MQPKSDNELIEEARQGTVSATSELFQRHYSSSLRIAHGVLHSMEDSRDVVQTAFLSAFRHLNHFRGDSTFKTWLTRIVVNQCFMHLRQPEYRFTWVHIDGVYAPGIDQAFVSPALTPERLTFSAEIGAALADGISRLPEQLRAVFTLYAGAGLSLKEVAAALGLTLPAVKTRLFRANRRMRAHLEALRPELRIPV